MAEQLRLSGVRAVPSTEDLREQGLLAWLSFVVNGDLLVDGAAIRKTRDGRLVISFPERKDRAGQRRPYVRPLSDAVRRELERQVFAELGLDAGGEPEGKQ